MMEYILCAALFAVGLYAVFAKRNLFKLILGIAILGYAVNLFFIHVGYWYGAGIPVLEHAKAGEVIVDPLVQAIVLTSIIFGLAITILLAALAVRLYEKYGTFDLNEIRRLKG
jgi:multicomponent Na+:H+ antiporter subunit C